MCFPFLYGGAVSLFFRQQRRLVFLIAALAVFSHWILDLLVHVPDLPLWGNSLKVGFGLWRHFWISLPLELALLLGGALLYVRYVPARGKGTVAFWIFVLLLVALQIYNSFGPPPVDVATGAKMALLVYAALALVAAAIEPMRARAPVRVTA